MTTQSIPRTYTLMELLTRLNLDFDEGTGKMDCPFCGSRKKLKLNLEDDCWRCPKCDAGGGVLHFYARYCLGMEDIPSRRTERGKLSKELRVFMDGDESATLRKTFQPLPPKPQKVVIPVANDDHLDAVYAAMAKIPALQLLPQHREELIRRGLTEEVIDRNGYCSIPENMPVADCYNKMYEDAGGETRRSRTLEWLRAKNIRFGLMIANSLVSQGLDLCGVPGFFRFGPHWCFWCVPGILIPTRNVKGQIVVWQVRKNKTVRKGEAKYITVAKNDLPGHVSTSVSRCHFPLGNAVISEDIPVIVTEGPLKADIACHLYPQPVFFAAIPGISTTKDLLSHADFFIRNGKKTILNGLDMDRLTNPNVRKGSSKLVTAFKKLGVTVKDMYWGTPYAMSKYISLSLIAKCRKVPVSFLPNTSVHEKLSALAIALENAGVVTCNSYANRNGDKETYYWEPATKGIDDYLLHSR